MTTGKFSGVDHDLLADYVGGALDGTPEETTVARLVEQDPAWAEAYAALASAVAQVRADLAGWAEPAPQMPLAVTERLTAALAGAGPTPAANSPAAADPLTGERQQSLPAQSGRGPGRTAGAGRDDATGPGRRRRRWARFAAPIALAAASLAAVGLGVDHLLDTSGGTAESTAAGSRGDAASATAPFQVTGAPQTSGTDWTPQTLAGGAAPTVLPRVATDGPGLAPGGSTEKAAEADRRPSPGGLLRLAAPDALNACLTEIAAEHGRGAITVELLDYASFQGEPALVLRFADPSGERWAWASGAECGVPGSGADTRYRARVG
ncbi:hypothetical protein [Micromonospora sp. DPT]|uniref:hypothetical protein n=1 Tax=Micromonospora sp. DPT TaxID=3142975 RepID=UPI003209A799